MAAMKRPLIYLGVLVVLDSAAVWLLWPAHPHRITEANFSWIQKGMPEAGKTIAFDPYRNLIFLPVRVNGSRPLSFVLDSGSGMGIIDRARARELGLKLEKGGQGVGVGDGV